MENLEDRASRWHSDSIRFKAVLNLRSLTPSPSKLDKYHLDANDGTANVKPSFPFAQLPLGFGTRTSRMSWVTLIYGPRLRNSFLDRVAGRRRRCD